MSSKSSLCFAVSYPEEEFPDSRTVTGLLLRAAQSHSKSGIRCIEHSSERFISYPALLDEALIILAGLRARGCSARSKVALLLERPADFIPAFWACLLGGLVPCPIAPIHNDPQRWAKHLSHVNTLLERPVLVTTRGFMQEIEGIDAVDLATLRTVAPEKLVYEARLGDPAFLVLTSGSTGNCKAVVLTHSNLLASLAGKNAFQKLSATDVTLNWISFDHVASIIEAHLLPLRAGATQVHVDSSSILADPLRFLWLIDQQRISMTFAPNFLFGQLNAVLQARDADLSLDLSCLRHIISGGEAIVVETGRKFLELLAPYGLKPSALWPAFGMSECCAGSVYSREFPHGDDGREFASLGHAIPGLEIRIVDVRGALVPEGEPGELQLRGSMVFGGYFNNEEGTRAAFTTDGWFRTGDLGRIEHGQLHLVGRSKDSIIVSGANYFSHELETVLEQLDGIERSYIAAFPTRPKGADTEQLVVAFAASFPVEDETRLYQLMAGIRNTTILLWGFRPALILPLPKEAMPKTSLGKTLRALLRMRLESGELCAYEAHAAAVMHRRLEYVAPQSAAQNAVAEIFARMFELSPVSTAANFFDLGGTSLQIVALKLEIEQRFGIDLPIVTLLQNPTVRALAAHVAPETRSVASDYDAVVPLQVSGHKTPLWCVHAGSGEVLVFVSLAGYFVHERPFYALRARGFNEQERYFKSFGEMVDVYVAAIRKRQPHGPYALAGYSYGAPVAFEIGKRLEAEGERVALVGAIDGTPTIGNVMARLDLIDSAVILAFFLSLIDRQQMGALPGQLRVSGQDPYSYIYEQAPPDRLAELDLDLPKFRAWVQLSHALVGIGESYEPSGTVESVSVFYAEPLSGTKTDWLRGLKQWDALARTANRYIEIDGEHHTLFASKHVATLQAALRAELDRALDGR